MTYHDIFRAAAEALQAVSAAQPGLGAAKAYDVGEIRHEHARAYAPWSSEVDEKLRQLFRSGANTTEMSKAFQRQPGAVRSRLQRLNLTPPARERNPPEVVQTLEI